MILEAANIRYEDPSPYYKMLGKLGEGGYARVFKCKRFSDGEEVALKFIELKDEQRQKTAIENEIGIM